MQHSAIHDPRALSTPSQREAAEDRRQRLERFQAAAIQPRFTFPPEPPSQPPIPNSVIAKAWDMIPSTPSSLSLNSVEPIQRAVVAEFPDVTMNDIKSARRTAVVVWPRQIAMYLAKELISRSLSDIGRRFGGRDHTTVLHAVRKIGALVKSNPDTAALVDRIKASVAEMTA